MTQNKYAKYAAQNITRSVAKLLDQDSRLRFCVSSGIANVRALSFHIIKHLKLSYNDIDAVISAVRRYHAEAQSDEKYARAVSVVAKSKITTKTGIAIIALVKDKDVQKELPKLFSIIEYARGEVLRIIQAEESIKIIIDQENVDKVTELFSKHKLKVQKSLAELNMKVHPSASKVPGVLAMICSELSSNDINIVETMSCVPELLWFVDESDVLMAHKALFEMSESLKQKTR